MRSVVWLAVKVWRACMTLVSDLRHRHRHPQPPPERPAPGPGGPLPAAAEDWARELRDQIRARDAADVLEPPKAAAK